MAEETIRLEIVTPEGQVFHNMVEWFYLPTQIGEIAVMHDHAPLLTAVVPGVLRLRREDALRFLAVGRGFLDVKENEAEILVQSAELAEKIDVERARRAKSRAEERLAEHAEGIDIDLLRAKAALARAEARLLAAQQTEQSHV